MEDAALETNPHDLHSDDSDAQAGAIYNASSMTDAISKSPDDEKGNAPDELHKVGAGENQEFTMEVLERILPDKHHRENFLRLIGQLEDDKAAITALKGHLVLEERITAAIEKFVFHPEQLQGARLQFSQKLSIARSLSLTEHENSIWDLVEKLNKLRNTLSHSLKGASRVDAMNALRSTYAKERELEGWEKEDEALLILSAVAYCLGFIDAFEQEVERFKEWVDVMDVAVNPHRYFPKSVTEKKPDQGPGAIE